MDLPSLVDEFLSFLEFNKKSSLHTLKDYRYYLAKFQEFHAGKGKPPIDEVLIEGYCKFLNEYSDEDGRYLKSSTKNYFLIALRSFLNFLEQEKGISVLNPDKIKLQPPKRQSPQRLDDESLDKLLQSTDLKNREGLRDRLVMDTLVISGLKVSELSSLNRSHIDLGSSVLIFTDKHGIKKSFKIPGETLEIFKKYFLKRQDDFNPLFIRFKGTFEPLNDGEKMRLSPRSIERLIEKYVKKIGLNIKATPLIFRHSFAFKELDLGKDLENLRLSLGHLSKNSTLVYERTKKSARQ